jgi:hypothetical protein
MTDFDKLAQKAVDLFVTKHGYYPETDSDWRRCEEYGVAIAHEEQCCNG